MLVSFVSYSLPVAWRSLQAFSKETILWVGGRGRVQWLQQTAKIKRHWWLPSEGLMSVLILTDFDWSELFLFDFCLIILQAIVSGHFILYVTAHLYLQITCKITTPLGLGIFQKFSAPCLHFDIGPEKYFFCTNVIINININNKKITLHITVQILLYCLTLVFFHYSFLTKKNNK